MNDRTDAGRDLVTEQAIDWVARIDAAGVSEADERAFRDWRRQHPAHDAAYRRVSGIGAMLKDVGRVHRTLRDPTADVVAFPRRAIGRRSLIGGAAAASLVAAWGVTQWPRLTHSGMGQPDYATGKAERRTVALLPGLSVRLDADTGLTVRHAADRYQIGLLDGRAEIALASLAVALTIRLGAGLVVPGPGLLDVELTAGRAVVTCLAGRTDVLHPAGRHPLRAGERIAYTEATIDPVTSVASAEAAAWKRGWLIFRDAALRDVVAQLNRYRHGDIVLANAALARRPVTGTFRVSRIDAAVDQIVQLTGARAIALPGGTLLLV